MFENKRRGTNHGESITPVQERAITALLSCRTLEDAAREARVAPATLRRWRLVPAFAAAYQAARLALLESATNALRSATSEAVDALLRNLTCGKPAAEIRAAEIILTNAYRSAEVEDLTERIAAIETFQAKEEGGDAHG